VSAGDWEGDDLAALAGDDQSAVTAFQTQMLEVRADGLRYPQPVEREKVVFGGRAEPGGDQDRAELVAVQGVGVRLAVHSPS